MFRIPEKLLNEIKKVIPVKKYTTGRPQSDIDQILNGIFYVIRNGNRWSDLPICYGPKSTVHGKFMALTRSGVFEKILQISIEFAVKNFGVPEFFLLIQHQVKLFLQNLEVKIQQIEVEMVLKKVSLLIKTESFYQ